MREFIPGHLYVIERDGIAESFRCRFLRQISGNFSKPWNLYAVIFPTIATADARTGSTREIAFIATLDASPAQWANWPMLASLFQIMDDPGRAIQVGDEDYIPMGWGSVMPVDEDNTKE